jgi:hypothetical protein
MISFDGFSPYQNREVKFHGPSKGSRVDNSLMDHWGIDDAVRRGKKIKIKNKTIRTKKSFSGQPPSSSPQGFSSSFLVRFLMDQFR